MLSGMRSPTAAAGSVIAAIGACSARSCARFFVRAVLQRLAVQRIELGAARGRPDSPLQLKQPAKALRDLERLAMVLKLFESFSCALEKVIPDACAANPVIHRNN